MNGAIIDGASSKDDPATDGTIDDASGNLPFLASGAIITS
jgi:hypothetical protein